MKYILIHISDGMFYRDDITEQGSIILINAENTDDLKEKCKAVLARCIPTEEPDSPLFDEIYETLIEENFYTEHLDYGTFRLMEIDEEV